MKGPHLKKKRKSYTGISFIILKGDIGLKFYFTDRLTWLPLWKHLDHNAPVLIETEQEYLHKFTPLCLHS